MKKQSDGKSLLVSIADAAEMLGGVTERTVEYLIRRKTVESRKLGKRRMILRSSLEEFCKHDHPRLRPVSAKEQAAASTSAEE